MSENVVSDSACLIGLERIGRSEILAESFKTIFIPPAVEKELGYKMEWLVVQPVRNVAFVKTLRTQLGEGESEAMVLAVELGEMLVLDDKKARRIAQRYYLKKLEIYNILISRRNGKRMQGGNQNRFRQRGRVSRYRKKLTHGRMQCDLQHHLAKLAGKLRQTAEWKTARADFGALGQQRVFK